MPVQAVQGRIRSSGPNAGGEVLPLSSVDGLSIDVVSLAAYEADIFVGKVNGRKVMEEMYSIEGTHFFRTPLVHGCREVRMGMMGRQASGLNMYMRVWSSWVG